MIKEREYDYAKDGEIRVLGGTKLILIFHVKDITNQVNVCQFTPEM